MLGLGYKIRGIHLCHLNLTETEFTDCKIHPVKVYNI